MVAQVGGAAQAIKDPQIGRVRAAQQNGREDCAPHGDLRQHPRHFDFPSALATSARRLVIHQMPPSKIEPVETTSGTSSSTRHVNAGSGPCGTFVFNPICSNGTAERYRTEVPPTSCRP